MLAAHRCEHQPDQQQAEYSHHIKQTIHILFSPAFEFQHIHEDAQQNVDDIINRFDGGDGAASGPPWPHPARHLDKTESFAL